MGGFVSTYKGALTSFGCAPEKRAGLSICVRTYLRLIILAPNSTAKITISGKWAARLGAKNSPNTMPYKSPLKRSCFIIGITPKKRRIRVLLGFGHPSLHTHKVYTMCKEWMFLVKISMN